MSRKWLIALLLLALALAPVSCSAPAGGDSGKLRVLASIAPLADFAREVGGDRVQVEFLIPPAASPHTYELTPYQLRSVSEARVLILNGIGLEYWADKVIDAAANPNLLVVSASVGIDILAGDEHDEGGNPHVWLSPLNAIVQVNNIARSLSEADPAGAATYEANARAYMAKLEALHQELAARASTFSQHEFISFHAAWDYFAHAYGLHIAAVVESTPGKQPSPAEVISIIETARSIGAKAIFAEAQFSPKAAQVIADESHATVLLLNPMGFAPDYDYIGMMRHNFAQIESALK